MHAVPRTPSLVSGDHAQRILMNRQSHAVPIEASAFGQWSGDSGYSAFSPAAVNGLC